MGSNRQHTFDALTEMKDAGAVTATGVAQVSSADRIIDLGGDGAQMFASMSLEVSAIDIANDDEQYDIVLQGSNSATFASGITELAALRLRASGAAAGAADDDATVGRYIVPWRNEKNGTIYQYVRLQHIIAGTSPSINYTAHLAKR